MLVPYYVRDGALRPLTSPLFGGGAVPEAGLPPIAVNDTFTTGEGQSVSIPVLNNDTAQTDVIDPGSVLIVTQPNNGSAGPNPNGSISFTPFNGFVGSVSFAYNVADVVGRRSNTALVTGTVTASGGGGGVEPGDRPGTVFVSNYSELANAISNAGAGTTIVTTAATISGARLVVNNSGTAQNPLVIRSNSILGTNIPGGVRLAGNHIVWRGFNMNLDGVGPNPMIQIGGVNNQVWRCRIRCKRDHVVFLNGSDGKFMYNESFNPEPNNHTQENQHILRGWFNLDTHHYRAEVAYNYFHDYPSKPVGSGYHEFRRFGIAAGSLFRYMFYEQDWHMHHNLLENGGSMRFACYGSKNLWEFNTVTGRSIPGSDVSCDFNQRLGRNNTWRGNWAEGTIVGHHVHGGPHTIIGHRVVNGGRIEVFAGDKTPDELTERYPNAFRVKLTACNAPLIIGRSWGSFMTRPAQETRVENHTGAITYGNHSSTVVTGNMTETPVAAIKMLPSMVGPFA